MKVRIESDGSPTGTHITVEDGTDLKEIVDQIEWSHQGGGLPVAILRVGFTMVAADVEARCVAPDGREIQSITYADGTIYRFDGVMPLRECVGTKVVRKVKGAPAN